MDEPKDEASILNQLEAATDEHDAMLKEFLLASEALSNQDEIASLLAEIARKVEGKP